MEHTSIKQYCGNERNLIGNGARVRKETLRYIEVLILSSWGRGETIENREGGHFWLGQTGFEVPVGVEMEMLSKQLETESQNNFPPWEICYLLGISWHKAALSCSPIILLGKLFTSRGKAQDIVYRQW